MVMAQSDNTLEDLYSAWSDKSAAQIAYDVEAAARKLQVIVTGVGRHRFDGMQTVVEIGCGYGRFLADFQRETGVGCACGFDFSAAAIDYAKANLARPALQFHRLESLDPARCAEEVRATVKGRIDCVVLIDVLEHIPDCRRFMLAMAGLAQTFLVKLPIESVLLDNYLLPKEYPGMRHSNGHLREFDVNTVHYFIRRLGLTPLAESLYSYDRRDMFPPVMSRASLKGRLFRLGLMGIKMLGRAVLPQRLFLRLIGGGGYYCLATFDASHMLDP